MADKDAPKQRWLVGDPKDAADTLAEIRYEIPSGFSESVVRGVTCLEDERHEMIFFVVRANQNRANQVMAELDGLLTTLFEDFKPANEPVGGTYNGMPGMQRKSTGTFQGQPVNVTMRILEAQPGKFVVVAGAYLSEKKEALKESFGRFFRSVTSGA
jgi:hypothetical protein